MIILGLWAFATLEMFSQMSLACDLAGGPWIWSIQRTAIHSDEIFVGQVLSVTDLCNKENGRTQVTDGCFQYEFKILRWVKGARKGQSYALPGSSMGPRRSPEIHYGPDCRLRLSFDLHKTYLVMPNAFHARGYMKVSGLSDPWVKFIDQSIHRGMETSSDRNLTEADIEGFYKEAEWNWNQKKDAEALARYRDAMNGCSFRGSNPALCEGNVKVTVERAKAKVALIEEKHRAQVNALEEKSKEDYKKGDLKQAYLALTEAMKFKQDPDIQKFQQEIYNTIRSKMTELGREISGIPIQEKVKRKKKISELIELLPDDASFGSFRQQWQNVLDSIP
ncbi:MAG: hypothetical protein HY399_01505 [Elusimicrobia bacterium]|nr:hypothetical protein [Elusimicrobiota bacterium]